MIFRLLISLCLLTTCLQAESVKSITGNIFLDVNNDGTSDAHLNSTGLAIGSGLSPSTNLHLQGNGIVTGDLVVGGTTGNSTLEIQGTVGYTHQTVSSNTTLGDTSIALVDTSSDNVTVTLPYAGNVTGRKYTIKKTSTSNTVTLEGGGNLIDSSVSYSLASGNTPYINVISNGSQWYILSKSSEGTDEGVVAADALVGWYKLDETSGSTAADSSGLSNDATFYNVAAGNVGVSGQIGNALDLDGSNDYLKLPSLTARSVSMWVNISSTQSSWSYLIDARSGAANGWFAQNPSDSTGSDWTSLYVNGSSVTVGMSSITKDSWVHVYLEAGSDFTDDINIGSKFGNGECLKVVVDDLRIYNRVLTSTEINAIYQEGQ